MRKIPLPEAFPKSKVNKGMTIARSIMDSVYEKPLRKAVKKSRLAFLKKYNYEQYLFETRGNKNTKVNPDLLDEREKAGQ